MLSAFIFERAGGSSWVKVGEVPLPYAVQLWGIGSLAIHEDTLVVGDEWDDLEEPVNGSVYVYVRDEVGWSEQAKLEIFAGRDSPEGIINLHRVSATVHGDVMAVGDHSFDNNKGRVRIYRRVDGTWLHEVDLTASDGADGDDFGSDVAFDGRSVVVGASSDDHLGMDSGSVYVFEPETEDTPCRDITIDFDEFETGSVPFNLGYGVTVKGDSKRTRSEGVMIFDTANPTGEDTDLASDSLGKVLILTEDGDSSEPDDNALGGVIKFFFDPPIAKVVSLDLLDFDAAGSKIAGNYADPGADDMKPKKIPATRDGEEQTVVVDEEDVAKLRVVLEGSGAIAALHLVYCPAE